MHGQILILPCIKLSQLLFFFPLGLGLGLIALQYRFPEA